MKNFQVLKTNLQAVYGRRIAENYAMDFGTIAPLWVNPSWDMVDNFHKEPILTIRDRSLDHQAGMILYSQSLTTTNSWTTIQVVYQQNYLYHTRLEGKTQGNFAIRGTEIIKISDAIDDLRNRLELDEMAAQLNLGGSGW